ncbi:hypothetical protein TrVE_jg14220 [Triparma verrucosa]|uniref:Uncharacterized protein n=1 Tax=Triparma verrucosa TaxID=1606542 RepID=A0A9W7EPQ0_9STRA|nr:hypothetical protein TrVE_jg14220 [Triparma verrucosa]
MPPRKKRKADPSGDGSGAGIGGKSPALSASTSTSSLPGGDDEMDMLRDRTASNEGSDFLSYLLLNGDSIPPPDDPMYDPIPVGQQQQQQQQAMAPPQMMDNSNMGAMFQQQQAQQQQMQMIQQMLMQQQQTLMKITEALPGGGGGGGGGGSSRGVSPVPPQQVEGLTKASSSTSIAKGALPPAVRRAKRPQNGEYETKLKDLKAENEQLKRHLDSINNKQTRVADTKQQSIIDMERVVNKMKGGERLTDGPNPTDELMSKAGLRKFINNYTNMYSDYGGSRENELGFHLKQLERLVMPTTTTKMGLWTLEQDDKFFENTGRGSLAGILARELQITENQKKKIIEHREEIKTITRNLKRTLELLSELKTVVGKKHSLFKDRMEKCTKILNPLQVIKLLLWVNKNEAELSETCPGWGSEQIIPEETGALKDEEDEIE